MFVRSLKFVIIVDYVSAYTCICMRLYNSRSKSSGDQKNHLIPSTLHQPVVFNWISECHKWLFCSEELPMNQAHAWLYEITLGLSVFPIIGCSRRQAMNTDLQSRYCQEWRPPGMRQNTPYQPLEVIKSWGMSQWLRSHRFSPKPIIIMSCR